MAQFVVGGSGTLNLSNQVFTGFDGISFQTTGDLLVILKDTQFNLLALPTDSVFTGSGFVDSIQIGISSGATFVGSSFSLATWIGKDTFSFYDNATGNENITGTQGNDRFYIRGGANDVVDGNLGADDVLFVRWGGLTNSVGSGSGFFSTFNATSVHFQNIDRFNVTVGSGNDVIQTGNGSDLVYGGAGDDQINTLAGKAQVFGGSGVDLWSADFSADGTAKVIDVTLTGQQIAGNGTIYQDIERLAITGGNGADVFTTRSGTPTDGLNDTLNGGGGNDTLTVGGGSDSVDGGAGNDLLIFNVGGALAGDNFNMAGSNTIITDFSTCTVTFTGIEHFNVTLGAGNDNVVLGAGADTLSGGAGNDALNTGAGAAVVDGGSGTDLWLADFSTDASAKLIDLNLVGVQAAANGTTYVNVERLSIIGGTGDDVISTRIGNALDGLNDTLNGGGGNDVLTVGGGQDSVDGGAGDDTLVIRYGSALAGDNFNMAGSNTFITDFSTCQVSFTGIEHFDVTLGAGTDNVVLGAGSDTLLGGAGDDTLNTGAGAAVVNGGIGNDLWIADFSADASAKIINLNLAGVSSAGNGTTYTAIERLSIQGGAGADVLTTKTGNVLNGLADSLFGGLGNDTLTVGGGQDSVDGGLGNDVLVIDYSTAYVGDNFNMAASNTMITDFSTAGVSFTGIERLNVRTGAGIDTIVLGTGNDTFSGGAGDDKVTGGGGADRLTGGAGADTFIYNAVTESKATVAGRDQIADFTHGSDHIDLRAIDAISGGGFDHFTFIGAAAFTGLGQLRVFDDGINTFVQANTAGGIAAEMTILLTGVLTLDVADFML